MDPESPDSPAAIRERIDWERAELSQTVEALAYKVDVKARAHDKAEELKARAEQLKDRAQDKAEAAVGAAREAVGHAVVVARRPSVLWPAAGVLAALAAIVVIVRRINR